MDFNLLEMLTKVALFFPPFLFALCFHEYAHGWAARKFGDRTAEYMGRLTMNPAAHADLLGTVILPMAGIVLGGFMFGWAKPVPVNPRNLAQPKEQMFWIAFAGPLSNVLLGFIGGFVFVLMVAFAPQNTTFDALRQMLGFFLLINAMLAVFNMIPLHPLDGGKVLARFLPESVNQSLESMQAYSSMLLFGLLIMGGYRLLWPPIQFLGGLFEMIPRMMLSLII